MYGDLSKNLGDNNLVEFFKAVLDRRDGLEEEKSGVTDTLGASSVFGSPGIRTRRQGDFILSADLL